MASYRLISILLAFGWTSACSSGGFGGLTGTKSGDEKKTSQENDENLDGEDGAKEDDPADDPTQVAGAFLTACAPTALPVTTQGVPVDDSIIIGCALIDKESKVKVPGNVELSSVSFELKDGTPFILPSEAAPAESPWHVVGYIARVTYLQIKSITGTAVVEGNPIEAGNDDPNVYDPENKIATIVPPAADPGTDRIRLAASNWFPTASTNYEQAFDDDSAKGWEISRSDFAAATGAWVLFDAGAIYSVRRIEVSFC